MKPQPNTEIVESPVFTMWLDEQGILCFIAKKHPPQTLKDSQQLFAEIIKISKGEKRRMLMDVTNFQMPDREARNYGSEELPKMVKAIAFLSGSALGAWVANAFFIMKPQPYPTKMFTNEKKAREWLEEYL